MKPVYTMMLAVVLTADVTATAVAEDDPRKVLEAASEATEEQIEQSSLNERWQTMLESMNLGTGTHEGEVITYPERNLIVSSASVLINVRLGQPGWVDSRVIAFEKAELEAKTKIIRFLSETVETQRSLNYMENAAWSDGFIQEVKDAEEVGETLERIGKKSLALTEAGLDSAIEKLDPDYDKNKYENQTPEQLEVAVKDEFKRKIKSMAMRTVTGITPIYSTEGEVEGAYEVMVGVIWSPKINRLAISLFNDEYNLPPVTPSKPLQEQVPKDEALLGTWGTRVVIDEKGDYTVMAYAQAQPRHASASRKQHALHAARQVAAERARAQLVNYIREGLSVRSEEEVNELLREYSDYSVGTEIMRKYQKQIRSSNTKVKIRGLRVIKEWDMAHPTTGQQVAGAVIAWSPSADQMSRYMSDTMKSRPAKKSETSGIILEKPAPGKVIESMPVDTGAY